ncbi:MAG: RsmE family RNA methyltransferase [Bacteroides sp.]|nr:RsmE family RNA methyltransferase [Prevotella sp.]MCM1407500.1 RsmE family RNA methyltransferase [Treponema brennaborense]MCM1469990.1 RsmE family RNA methyltransferase [Bacteroides sp.]
MNIVLFEEHEISEPLPLEDARAVHILSVLHKTQGDTFAAGIINGSAGTARITAIVSGGNAAPQNRGTHDAAVDETGEHAKPGIYFDFAAESDGKPLYPLVLIVGFPRPIQLKRLFRDAAGLGVCAVHLVATELGEKSYLKSNIVARGAAREALTEGTAQAKSTHVPELFLHKNIRSCLDVLSLPAAENQSVPKITLQTSVKILLDNIAPECSLAEFLCRKIPRIEKTPCAETEQADFAEHICAARNAGVIAAVGSERGWTDAERALFARSGFAVCGMGARVLRTETAAAAASALILSQMGKLG